MRRSAVSTLAAALLPVFLALPSAAARAQGYPLPDKVLSVICGYPAGSGADTNARYFAGKLAAVSGQRVIVENKPGMITVIAGQYVARAKPDGYTIYLAVGNAHAASPYAMKKLPFDAIRDFTPVTTLAKSPNVLIVDPGSPYTSLKELTGALLRKGDTASYAYTSWTGLASAELYKQRTGTKALGIPYKGTLEAMPALKSGQIDFQFLDAGMATQQVRAGRMRALAVTGTERSSVLPDVPTMIESGHPEFDILAWSAVLLPAGAPQPVVEKLEAWFNQILAMEETRRFLADQGAVALPGNSKSLAGFLSREIAKWAELLKLARVEPQ